MDKLHRRAAGLIAQRQLLRSKENKASSQQQATNTTTKENKHEAAAAIKPLPPLDANSKLSVAPLEAAAAAAKSLRPAEETPSYAEKQQQQQQQATAHCLTTITRSRLATLAQIGEDWLYLALLGIIMALLSFSMDSIITLFLNTRLWLSQETSEHNLLVQYLAWCLTPILLVTFSTGFVHLCSPTAIGSGIPEMKTILRGVVLNEYLTFRTLVAKIVGLTFTLGSGLPLGKEGPSVHMASIVATLLSKLVASFQGIYENESRTSEMLSAACAVGVAATFYAPIGGVLFSIEVTTVYFAVRNYWRGFFAACCGATVWRLLGFWIENDESISALFKTNFSTEYPFDPVELLVFSFIGATCGLAGAAYIKFHREIVQFFRRHKRISGFLQQNRFVYPTLVTLIITSSTFPPFIGKYTAATLGTHTTIEHLFSNRTWSLGNQDLTSSRILEQWTTQDTDFHLHLMLYILMLFWTSALASTIPTPSGVFIPVLKMGAAYGRLLGELMATTFPNGIKYSRPAAIVPGSYAVVGAAALSGAVTHTVSTSVILFEMTGQIVHIIPVILGVLISNAVCQSLQPSIYDSIIEIKKLPYLPPIASSNSVSHRILVRDFMNTNIPFVWKEKCTYADLKSLLSANKKIMSFPLVESPQTMKLLGSIARPDLLKLLYLHLGRERRLQEVCRRNSDTLSPAIQLLTTISGRVSAEPQQQQQHDQEKCTGNKLKRSESAPQAHVNHTPATAALGESAARGGTLGYSAHSTALIVRASRPQNYGSTTSESSSQCKTIGAGKQLAPAPLLHGDHQLLSDCQKARDRDDEVNSSASPKQVLRIAKMINHYNKGSTMDEDLLDKSIQEVEDHLASASEGPPEIMVLVTPNPPSEVQQQQQQVSMLPVHSSRLSNLSYNRTQLHSPLQFSVNIPASPSLSSRPTKSILKTSSFNNVSHKRNISSQLRMGTHMSENSLENKYGNQKNHLTSNLKLSLKTTITNDDNTLTLEQQYNDNNKTRSKSPAAATDNSSKQLTTFTIGENKQLLVGPTTSDGAQQGNDSNRLEQRHQGRRKVRLPHLRVVDMTPEEQEQWEHEQLNAHIDMTKCQIDEAPFQLVEQTSLYRVHTLFSMLGLNHAYVTSFGRLVGIVALKDIRYALERMLQEK